MGFFRQNTGVGCHFLLQGIFPLGIEPRSPELQADSLPLSHLGSPLNYSPWNSPGQNTGVGSLSLLQGISPTQGSNRSPSLHTDSLPAEPQGKSKNTGVGSLSLLQQIFPTQESNQSLLHCRWILYQPSYQRRPELLYRYWKRSYMSNTIYFMI